MREPAAPRENDHPGVRPLPTWRERSSPNNFGARGQARSLFLADGGDSGSQRTGKASGFIEDAELRDDAIPTTSARPALSRALRHSAQPHRRTYDVAPSSTPTRQRHPGINRRVLGDPDRPGDGVATRMAAIMSRQSVRRRHPRTKPLIVGNSSGWLFPGVSAIGPINASTMSRRWP